MKGVIAVVAYRLKPDKETELLELVRNRVPTPLKEGLVTNRKPTITRSRDGTIVEVSEWKSQEAIDAAHKNPNVLAM
jgi:quinol monooxygenase YgiN